MNVSTIDILSVDNKKLEDISKEYLLSLNLREMLAVKDYFSKKGRNPTDVELETIAQTWSEHCKHKTLMGLIEYSDKNGTMEIDNLLKQTVMKVTRELKKDWCLSVFKDNAGVISFDERFAIAFKVETHNHPSALEPYGGAGTGIGGVIRDVLGVGLGAKPIFNTDIFCFGPFDYPFEELPEGVLHPKRICKGVVAGVRDYGNRMGIPTVNGSVFFDEGYIYNPLVYCGTAGIMPRHMTEKKVEAGDLIVSVGGRTGRDGIHGATFSSLTLDKDTEVSAVQIGNPITEKKVTDTVLAARDKGLYRAITDCGAGGFSSAVGELGQDCGARVDLEKAPLKYEGLAPWEIWVSEAQERMVLAVPKEKIDDLLGVFSAEDVSATVIGEFTADRVLDIRYEGATVGRLDMDFLHHGVPGIRRKAVWKESRKKGKEKKIEANIAEDLKKILSSPNVCSKEWIIRQYDHEVQGGTVLKPLQGILNDGPGDACVIKPLFDSDKGIVISNGINPLYGTKDPYWMAASAIDEALRNIVCAGGNLEKTALLDNFCWGDPAKPAQLAGIVRAARACYDMAKVYGTPFISGKDSLNNEYVNAEGERASIPPTLLISGICIIPDIKKTVSMDLKKPGNAVYVLGGTKNELGGSHYYLLHGMTGGTVPQVEPKRAKKLMGALGRTIEAGLVKSCHDCSEGGIAVAASEMAFSGGLGMEIDLRLVPCESKGEADDAMLLFSESNSRFIVEIEENNTKEFEKVMAGNVFSRIGRTAKNETLRVLGKDGSEIIKESIYILKGCWQKTMKW